MTKQLFCFILAYCVCTIGLAGNQEECKRLLDRANAIGAASCQNAVASLEYVSKVAPLCPDMVSDNELSSLKRTVRMLCYIEKLSGKQTTNQAAQQPELTQRNLPRPEPERPAEQIVLPRQTRSSGEPSELEITSILQADQKSIRESFLNVPILGREMADNVGTITGVRKLGCERDGRSAYLCDIEAYQRNAGKDSMKIMSFRIVNSSQGWVITNYLDR